MSRFVGRFFQVVGAVWVADFAVSMGFISRSQYLKRPVVADCGWFRFHVMVTRDPVTQKEVTTERFVVDTRWWQAESVVESSVCQYPWTEKKALETREGEE